MPLAKILITDDDAGIRTLLAEALEAEDYAVVTAENGLEGMEKARNEQPHLIISDIQMPDMDGVEFNTHLQLDPRTKDIPVLMMTGNDHKHVEVSVHFSRTMKFEYILSKSTPIDGIVAKVKEIMSKYYML